MSYIAVLLLLLTPIIIIIQGRRFWYQSKSRVHILISGQ